MVEQQARAEMLTRVKESIGEVYDWIETLIPALCDRLENETLEKLLVLANSSNGTSWECLLDDWGHRDHDAHALHIKNCAFLAPLLPYSVRSSHNRILEMYRSSYPGLVRDTDIAAADPLTQKRALAFVKMLHLYSSYDDKSTFELISHLDYLYKNPEYADAVIELKSERRLSRISEIETIINSGDYEGVLKDGIL